jgi:hypothetical protein
MANVSAKCDVMSPESDTQRSPLRRSEANLLPYPLRRGLRPQVEGWNLRWFRFRELRQLTRFVAAQECAIESIRHFEIPVKHLISERRIQGVTCAGAGDLDALEAPCSFRAYDLGRKPLALTL